MTDTPRTRVLRDAVLLLFCMAVAVAFFGSALMLGIEALSVVLEQLKLGG